MGSGVLSSSDITIFFVGHHGCKGVVTASDCSVGGGLGMRFTRLGVGATLARCLEALASGESISLSKVHAWRGS